MLSSAGIQPGIANHSSSRLFPARNQIRFLKNRTISLYPNKAQRKPFTISSSLTQESTIVEEKKKVGVVVKAMERPRLVLKFMWMEKNIGIAVDQVIAGGGGTIPVSPYYFWPRKDAWEELKLMLESKHWISYKQMVLLLNQATEIINLWQQSGGGTS